MGDAAGELADGLHLLGLAQLLLEPSPLVRDLHDAALDRAQVVGAGHAVIAGDPRRARRIGAVMRPASMNEASRTASTHSAASTRSRTSAERADPYTALPGSP